MTDDELQETLARVAAERDQLRAELATMPGRLRYLNDSLKKAEAERDQLRADKATLEHNLRVEREFHEMLGADKAALVATLHGLWDCRAGEEPWALVPPILRKHGIKP